MTSKRITNYSKQLIQLNEGIILVKFHYFGDELALVVLTPHELSIYLEQTLEYTKLYDIEATDILFLSFTIQEEILYIGTSSGSLLLYEVSLVKAVFLCSLECTKCAVTCLESGSSIFVQSGSTLFTLQGKTFEILRDNYAITDIERSGDHRLFCLARINKQYTVIALDTETTDYYQIDKSKQHSRPVSAFALLDNLLVTGDTSGMIVLWDINDISQPKMIYCFKEGNYRIVQLQISAFLLIFMLDCRGNVTVLDANRKIVVRRWNSNFKGTIGSVLDEKSGTYCTYDSNSFLKVWSVWDKE